jgi:AraC family transcriptional regulator
MDTGGGGTDFGDDGKLGRGASMPIHETTQHASTAGIANGGSDSAHAFIYGLSATSIEDGRHTLILDEVLLTINWHDSRMNPSAKSGTPDMHVVSRTWSGIEVRYTERRPGPGESWLPVFSKDTTIIIRLDQRGGICEPRLRENTPTIRGRRDVGFFNWIPENQKIWCYADNVQCVRDLQLRFDQTDMETILGSACKHPDIQEPLLMIYDTRVMRCASVLSDAVMGDFQDDTLYGESLTTALLVALRHAADGRPLVCSAEGLASWQLRIAKEYLEDQSACGASLADLARLIGFSQSRLARGFKASTGLAPYTWAMQARIRKAKVLLTDDRIPLSEVALQLGFADQSHFTKAFKRGAGITPGEWRHNKTGSLDQRSPLLVVRS